MKTSHWSLWSRRLCSGSFQGRSQVCDQSWLGRRGLCTLALLSRACHLNCFSTAGFFTRWKWLQLLLFRKWCCQGLRKLQDSVVKSACHGNRPSCNVSGGAWQRITFGAERRKCKFKFSHRVCGVLPQSTFGNSVRALRPQDTCFSLSLRVSVFSFCYNFKPFVQKLQNMAFAKSCGSSGGVLMMDLWINLSNTPFPRETSLLHHFQPPYRRTMNRVLCLVASMPPNMTESDSLQSDFELFCPRCSSQPPCAHILRGCVSIIWF